MTDQADNAQNNEANEPPVFRMQKMFIKDLSFENPNAPDVFAGKQGEPKVDLNLGLKHKKLSDDGHFEVLISVNATISHGEDDKKLFILELEHGGVFLLKNIPAQHLPAVLAVDCPTMMFPFTRQLVSQLSVDGGYMPFLLEPVNFLGLFQNAQKQRAEEAKSKQQ